MATKVKEAMVALLHLIGLALSCATLLAVLVCVHINHCCAHVAVVFFEWITGAKIRSSLQAHKQRQENIKNVKYEEPVEAGIIDTEATLSVANSAKNLLVPKFSPETLFDKTRKLLNPDAELGSKRPELLADDFQAMFPSVGPLDKQTFCTAMRSFNCNEAFPPERDSRSNYYGFTVDPTELNRVWFFSRSEMVHRGMFKFGRLEIPTTYNKILSTAQVFSMSFDNEGRCYKFTGGYSVDGTSGNCGGLGGFFGILHHYIKPGSLPFPEGRPWRPSLEWQVWYDRVPQIGHEWNNFTRALYSK